MEVKSPLFVSLFVPVPTSYLSPSSIQLSVHLYSEQLLDTEHYLDWLLFSLENTPLTRLPIWLLIAKVYWVDILRHRKTGRRLVGALCSNLQTVRIDRIIPCLPTNAVVGP